MVVVAQIFVVFMTLYYIKYYDSIKVISIQKTSVTDRCGVSSSVVVSLYQFSEDL